MHPKTRPSPLCSQHGTDALRDQQTVFCAPREGLGRAASHNRNKMHGSFGLHLLGGRQAEIQIDRFRDAIANLRASFQAAAAIYRVDLEPPEIEISQDHSRIAADLEELKSGAVSPAERQPIEVAR
jgi:hypothetical protein